MGNSRAQKEAEVTSEGWVLIDFDLFRFCIENHPPRHRAYVYQLSVDARSWKPIAFWAVGIGCIGLALVIGQWLLVLVGIIVLSIWFRLFLSFARSLRDSVLLTGVIKTLDPHPMLNEHSTARAQLADGRTIPVVLLDSSAREIVEEHGSAEVMFLCEPSAEFSLAIAVRPTKG